METAQQLDSVKQPLSTQTMLSNGVQESNHEPCWMGEVTCD